MKIKKERLYKQLSALKKCYKKLIKTELCNLNELKAVNLIQAESSTALKNFNLILVLFN